MSYRPSRYHLGLGQTKGGTSTGTGGKTGVPGQDNTARDVATATGVATTAGQIIGGIIGAATGHQQPQPVTDPALLQQQYAPPESGIDWYWPVIVGGGLLLFGGIAYVALGSGKKAPTANRRRRGSLRVSKRVSASYAYDHVSHPGKYDERGKPVRNRRRRRRASKKGSVMANGWRRRASKKLRGSRRSRSKRGSVRANSRSSSAGYYSVRIPWSAHPTQWHPSERTGPFSVLTRGAFATDEEAHGWARSHLRGQPYSVVRHSGVNRNVGRGKSVEYTARLDAPSHSEEVKFSDATGKYAILFRTLRPVVEFKPTPAQTKKILSGKGKINITEGQIVARSDYKTGKLYERSRW